jgi:hypothetical protein
LTLALQKRRSGMAPAGTLIGRARHLVAMAPRAANDSVAYRQFSRPANIFTVFAFFLIILRTILLSRLFINSVLAQMSIYRIK